MSIKSIWVGLAMEKGVRVSLVWGAGMGDGGSKSEVKPALNSAAVVKRRGQAMENVKQGE